MFPGIIIAGGWNRDEDFTSAEIFQPNKRSTCPVGKFNIARYGHSMCNNIVCGGDGEQAQRTCEKFDGISSFTSLPVRLVGQRWSHSCWGLKSGDVLLLGGYYGDTETAERVSADGSSSSFAFKLPYKTQLVYIVLFKYEYW